MKFKFTYESILNLKENETSQSEWQLAAAVSEKEKLNNQLKKWIQMKEKYEQKNFLQIEQSESISTLQTIATYLQYVEEQIKKIKIKLNIAQVHVDEKQLDLTEKLKTEQVWNKIREQEFARFEQEVLHKQQNELDELAIARYMRTSS